MFWSLWASSPRDWTASIQIADYRWERNDDFDLNYVPVGECPENTIRGFYTFSGKGYGPKLYYPEYNGEPAWDRLYRDVDSNLETLRIQPPSCGSARLQIASTGFHARHGVATSDTPTEPPQALVADFVYSPEDNYAPNRVEFADRSALPAGCDPSYEWYFDYAHDHVVDSTEINTVHTYDDVGTYSVRLIVRCRETSDDRFRELIVEDRTGASCPKASQPQILYLKKEACVDPRTGDIVACDPAEGEGTSLLASASAFLKRLFGSLGIRFHGDRSG